MIKILMKTQQVEMMTKIVVTDSEGEETARK
jgi:hypothetical protein